MPSSIKLTEPLDILVEYGYLDEDIPYHKALSNAVMDFAEDPTLGGEYNKDYVMLLQDEAKKELKLRRKKIDVKSFKEKFLNKKEEPVKADATGTSSIVPYKPPAPTPDLSLPEGEEQKQETEGLKGIRDILDDILKVLRLDFKGDRKEAREARKAKLDADRKAKENKLEGGGLKKSLGLIGSSAKALLSPFQSIWDALINFLKFTFLGVLLNDTLDWFKDPENQKKAQRIGKFFKDWWPALAAAGLLWLTPLGALLKGVVGLLTAIIPKLVIAIAANPYAALAVVGTGLTIWGVHKLAGMKSRPTEAVDESVEEIGREETINELKEEQENRSVMGRVGDFFTGAGAEREQQIERLGGNVEMKGGGLVNDQTSAQNFIQKFNEGGLVQNFQGGGFSNITNTETTSSSDSEGNFSFGATYVSPEEAKERLATMGMPSMELWDGSIVPNFGKMGADQIMQGIEMVRQNMVESGADPKRISKLDELMDMPEATPKFIQNIVNRTVPGSTEQVLGDMGDSITASAKNYKQGGFVSGPGGVDKVPARLTAGEFVMSKGAVQKFGVNTLASMNAAGGGTNVPTITQEYNQGGLVQYLENGGVVGDVMKEPVGTPIVQSTNRTITLPTIPKQQQDQKVDMTENDIPDFRIPIISSQRSMILSSLGIQDLIGG